MSAKAKRRVLDDVHAIARNNLRSYYRNTILHIYDLRAIPPGARRHGIVVSLVSLI